MHLITHGVPTRYPNIKIINSHLGGALPMLLQRADNQYQREAPDAPPKHRASRRVGRGTTALDTGTFPRCAAPLTHSVQIGSSSVVTFHTKTETRSFARSTTSTITRSTHRPPGRSSITTRPQCSIRSRSVRVSGPGLSQMELGTHTRPRSRTSAARRSSVRSSAAGPLARPASVASWATPRECPGVNGHFRSAKSATTSNARSSVSPSSSAARESFACSHASQGSVGSAAVRRTSADLRKAATTSGS